MTWYKAGFPPFGKTFPTQISYGVLTVLSRNNFKAFTFAEHFTKRLHIDYSIYSHYYSMRYMLVYTF